MKTLKTAIALLAATVLFASCQKEDAIDPNKVYISLGGDKIAKTELDYWIYDNFTKPYNMSVEYRWSFHDLDYTRTMVPVDESKVKPIMQMVKSVWLDPYEQLAGSTFVRTYCPKQYVLVGSPQFNVNDGTITLGEAEGGLRVTLYRLNWLSGHDRDLVCEVMKTVHHEFTHILNQKHIYMTEYEKVTPAGYISTWNASANSDDIARDLGFISRYSRASPNEDFAEMVARIAIYGHDAFMARVNASTDDGKAALLRKEQMMVEYMKTVWNVDFYDTATGEKGLVTLVQEAIDDVVANGF